MLGAFPDRKWSVAWHIAGGELTLAVVLLQDLKASPAAAMASFVWARVISGTVPRSVLLAGSTSDRKRRISQARQARGEE